ncbi:MAG TPA: hypothetical protein VFN95_15025 [Flavitalea sp.]|nr:hypothetical protein [Flavitalea sp.]
MDSFPESWAPDSDALIAAPKHHKLLFENEFVRVLDTNIPPGEKTAAHTHQYPASLYILSWSDFIRYDADGNVIVDSRRISKAPAPRSALWTGSLPLHSLENIGQTDLNVISVEIKTHSMIQENPM